MQLVRIDREVDGWKLDVLAFWLIKQREAETGRERERAKNAMKAIITMGPYVPGVNAPLCEFEADCIAWINNKSNKQQIETRVTRSQRTEKMEEIVRFTYF